jgi:hypothetical protein
MHATSSENLVSENVKKSALIKEHEVGSLPRAISQVLPKLSLRDKVKFLKL